MEKTGSFLLIRLFYECIRRPHGARVEHHYLIKNCFLSLVFGLIWKWSIKFVTKLAVPHQDNYLLFVYFITLHVLLSGIPCALNQSKQESSPKRYYPYTVVSEGPCINSFDGYNSESSCSEHD